METTDTPSTDKYADKSAVYLHKPKVLVQRTGRIKIIYPDFTCEMYYSKWMKLLESLDSPFSRLIRDAILSDHVIRNERKRSEYLVSNDILWGKFILELKSIPPVSGVMRVPKVIRAVSI